MHRNKSFRTGKKPTSLRFSFLFLFFWGGGFPFSPYDLKALAEVIETKQCMKNGYVPPCVCVCVCVCFFFYTVDFGVSKCEETAKVKNLVNQAFKNLSRCIFYSTDVLK